MNVRLNFIIIMVKPDRLRNNHAIRPVLKSFDKFHDNKFTMIVKPDMEPNEMNGIHALWVREEAYKNKLNPDKIKQQAIRVMEQPSLHMQDKVNPYWLADKDRLKREILMKEGITKKFNFLILPRGDHY